MTIKVGGIEVNAEDITPNPKETFITEMEIETFVYDGKAYSFRFTAGEYFTVVMFSDPHVAEGSGISVADMQTKATNMINSTYTFDEINAVSNSSFADILEMSICLPETYGERLNAKDLVRYEYLSNHSAIPTVVPTQHLVLPTDVKALYKCGVKAVMVGAISMGKDIETISKTLKEFRKEIDKL
jgi:hypothetical protein